MNKLLHKTNIEDMYPLSPLQRGMLFHAAYGGDSTAYLEQVTISLHGELDAASFERAWNALIDENAVLRTVFRWRNLREPVQVVLRSYPLTLSSVDLRGLPDDAAEAFLLNDRSTPFA